VQRDVGPQRHATHDGARHAELVEQRHDLTRVAIHAVLGGMMWLVAGAVTEQIEEYDAKAVRGEAARQLSIDAGIEQQPVREDDRVLALAVRLVAERVPLIAERPEHHLRMCSTPLATRTVADADGSLGVWIPTFGTRRPVDSRRWYVSQAACACLVSALRDDATCRRVRLISMSHRFFTRFPTASIRRSERRGSSARRSGFPFITASSLPRPKTKQPRCQRARGSRLMWRRPGALTPASRPHLIA
jgi:hypothetical protein